MRFLRTATALTLCAAGALSQQRTEPLPTFSESVEVRVLNLDVDVTDSKGAPRHRSQARGLHAQDRQEHGSDRLLLARERRDPARARPRDRDPGADPRRLQERRGRVRPAQLPGLRGPRLPAPGLPQPQPECDPGPRDPPRAERRHARGRLQPLAEGPRGLDDEQGKRDGRALGDRVQGRRHVAPPGPDAGDGADRRHGLGPPQRELPDARSRASTARKSAPRSRT